MTAGDGLAQGLPYTSDGAKINKKSEVSKKNAGKFSRTGQKGYLTKVSHLMDAWIWPCQ